MRALLPLLIFALPATAATKARRPPELEIPLRVRVARCKGKPVRDQRWVASHLAATRRILARHGITLDVQHETFTPSRCELLDASHRHAMASHVMMDGKATVLVVQRVRDLDVKSYNLMGVHWRYRGKMAAWRGRRWVFLTARARPPVLAHELAHYFGLRHDRAGGTLMTPGPSDPAWRSPKPPRPFAPRLTPAQAERLRRAIARLRRGASRPLDRRRAPLRR